jgi:hypothetical protein
LTDGFGLSVASLLSARASVSANRRSLAAEVLPIRESITPLDKFVRFLFRVAICYPETAARRAPRRGHMRTFKLAPALLLMLFGANVNAWAASIPNWIRPNIVVTYDVSSEYTGSPPRPLETFNTITVTGVSATAVSGKVHSVSSTGFDFGTSTFTCGAEVSSCADPAGLFWVDPGDPIHSEYGPNAEPVCTNRGTAPYTRAGAT